MNSSIKMERLPDFIKTLAPLGYYFVNNSLIMDFLWENRFSPCYGMSLRLTPVQRRLQKNSLPMSDFST